MPKKMISYLLIMIIIAAASCGKPKVDRSGSSNNNGQSSSENSLTQKAHCTKEQLKELGELHFEWLRKSETIEIHFSNDQDQRLIAARIMVQLLDSFPFKADSSHIKSQAPRMLKAYWSDKNNLSRHDFKANLFEAYKCQNPHTTSRSKP